MTYAPRTMTVDIEPQVFVVFGGTGDLAHTKLLPALYALLSHRHFHDRVEVLAVAVGDRTDEQYRESVVAALAEAGHEGAEAWANEFLHFQSIDAGFERLTERIEEIETASGLPGNRVFYLAIPPTVLEETVSGLGKHGLTSAPGWVRVVVEKPFGSDLSSAAELNAMLHAWFDEGQIYRIDHYLGKESVQNIMALRFANPLFEKGWNRDGVDCVQITVAEDIGIGRRAGYYEHAGAVRDIVQNHALQLLTLIAMEPPVTAEANATRNEKVKVLQAIDTLDLDEYVMGQYVEGVSDGQPVVGYREEPGVAPNSETETFVALCLHIDNWRWKGVPFYIRAGKRMASRATQVSVVFREPPVCLFGTSHDRPMHAQVFDIRLQPSEGFELSFEIKTPGEGYNLQTQRLHFHYDEAFAPLPPAYETLLADVMTGDQTLFVRADEVEEAWRIVAPALTPGRKPVDPYVAGSGGPPSADELLARTGRVWQPLEVHPA